MKVGDLVNLRDFNVRMPEPVHESVLALVVEVWDFGKYCKTADDNLLEIDIEEAWEHWQVKGPMITILNPLTKKMCNVWRK